MMRTLFSSILGLRAHQTQMDVISNNVSNVNTFGFKRARTVFQDILSQTLSFSTAPSAGKGGINAVQVGLGVATASVDNIFTQGAVQNTGRTNDVAVQGEGFLVAKDGNRQLYTRTGTLDIDTDSNLVYDGTGLNIQGWMAKEDPFTKAVSVNASAALESINFKPREKLSAKATSTVEYRSNLQSSAEERNLPASRVMTFKDDKGGTQQVTFNFQKIDRNNWNWVAIDDSEGQVGNGVLSFDDEGKILSSTGGPLLAFDPDGARGRPPSLTLQQNNTASITNATLQPLTAETWAMTQRFSVNGVVASTDTLRVNQLFDITGPVAGRFDLRLVNGNEQIIVAGIDGNGDTIPSRAFPITTTMTISDLVQSIKTAFPNTVAAFDPNTGKITLTDASPGIAKRPSFTLQWVDPENNTTFPGLTTSTTPNPGLAGGTVQTVAGTGTVKDGVHSITVQKVAATAATVPGTVTGLTRFTSFADLDIGDTGNFSLAIDGNAPQKVFGLLAGQYATQVAGNTVSPPPGGGYAAGNIVINGFSTSWNAAAVAGMTQDQYGAFLADSINTTFDAVAGASPQFAIWASYDNATDKVTLQQRNRGANFKIDVNSTAVPNETGFDANAPVAFGTNGSSIGDLIDGINNQIPGAVAEIQGDRLVVKRALTGAIYNVAINDAIGLAVVPPANANTPPVASTFSIGQRAFGSDSPATVPGSDQSFTLIDLFTPNDGTGSVSTTFNDFKAGGTIGTNAIGRIIIDSTGLQAGTATITTVSEKDSGVVRIAIPTVNSTSAAFTVQTGGTPQTDVSVAMVKGAAHTAATSVFDSLGNKHEMAMVFEKVEPSLWQYSVNLSLEDPLIKDYFIRNPIKGIAPTDLELSQASDAVLTNRRGYLAFTNFGRIDPDRTSALNGVNLPETVKNVEFLPKNAQKVSIKPNIDAVTQFDSAMSTAARSQDGYEMGLLSNFEIGGDGTITGTYTNGFKQEIAKLALALFTNSGGLEKTTNSMFAQSPNSGLPQIGSANSGGRGTFVSQSLEMSNVDLAREFTDMIIAQRGFQANARSITTADQFLQELISLKR